MISHKAKLLAKQLHANQVDKAGKAYVEHLQSVADGLVQPTDDELAVAWLHDSVEDTTISLAQIKAEFGSVIANAIGAITKRKDEPYETYLKRVKANDIARKVKIADLTHNMDLSRLAKVTEKDIARQQKYQQAKLFLLT
ncbi:HD domain-containing protein [Glaesserella parasuis]|uniref:HD domain-containing protein n=1 Tax=Glaesserella parasuis TaxID=738 RepID=A0A145QLQ0_GLAPU|nr:HD domain-containing protein [Glaesserella parasuis]EQA03385.1 putative GTP pyrophosphokinase [Glaesserella parasuis MN-H]AMW17147.1 guanosine-3',5'-bis(diphosphate) 3'-pyrophosphohydrolase [Glaesserella parasuis]KDB44788.1 guanosine-3',5'-bis(diphosphate) 3'-pyrophosphohydrolase [Glaesserella parasuis HPS11]MCT8517329.1 HD domain-containing protein [Glaesserella parasuis]MCT8526688.1 HD domain-containing protein [Glaesserella parasuis]